MSARVSSTRSPNRLTLSASPFHCSSAAQVADLGRATVQRYLAAFREGGLDGLRAWGVTVIDPVDDRLAPVEAILSEVKRRL